MAKTIKFNLLCDGRPIRTIDDLQNNFVIEDILDYYENQLLHRWLEVRGYKKELEEVSNIKRGNLLEILKELIRIFNVDTDMKEIEKSIYILEYQNKKNKQCRIYSGMNYRVDTIINDYKEEYFRLIDEIIKNPQDISKIKANIDRIVTDYLWIFELNYYELYYKFKKFAPLAIMCILMRNEIRWYYLPIDDNDLIENTGKKKIYEDIKILVNNSQFLMDIREHIHQFGGMTDGYWKDLETADKKYMIISMGQYDMVRSAGVKGGDLKYEKVNWRFVILDGIDYKSNSDKCMIRYMEV